MAQKKIATFGLKERLRLIEKCDDKFSMREQIHLLSINRSSAYYKPIGINEYDRRLMNLLDEQYTETPFYGVLRMRQHLKSLGYNVGKDHVRTLLRGMGLEAIYPKPWTSKMEKEHKVYPYLLGGVKIDRPNYVWSIDITYVRLAEGYAYLTAIIDWFSRYVLSWRLSNTLDVSFCLEAMDEALVNYGRPQIFNSDQGSQFTSREFVGRLSDAGISISMDGRGRVFDNIFIERLWRTIKYENIYLYDYRDIPETKDGLRKYFIFYNEKRFHQALDYQTPWQVYFGRYKTITPIKIIDCRANESVLKEAIMF